MAFSIAEDGNGKVSPELGAKSPELGRMMGGRPGGRGKVGEWMEWVGNP